MRVQLPKSSEVLLVAVLADVHTSHAAVAVEVKRRSCWQSSGNGAIPCALKTRAQARRGYKR